MTIIEKILARASGAATISPGDLAVVAVDMTVIDDIAFYPNVRREILKVHDPDKIAIIFDHTVPAADRASADAHVYGRDFARRFGVRRFHDAGPDQGISHVIVAEHGYALPGTVLIGADSHTCAAGAVNCAARGVGYPDMVYAATTGKAWFQVGSTVRYDLDGQLAPGVSTKDAFLHIAQTYGEHANLNVEFGGAGLAFLNMNARATLSTMGAELSAEFVTFEPDDVLIRNLRERTTSRMLKKGLPSGPLA